MRTIKEIRNLFAEKYASEDFVEDKNGGKVIELIGESFIADEPSIFDKVNEDYVKKELEWYLSQSLNVYDIPNTPKIWKMVSSPEGLINSNYGWCLFSKSNYSQYSSALAMLVKDKYSRRASMVYTRPSIQQEYSKGGMDDFICTNAVTYFIRGNSLDCVVQMRSNDVWAGYRNDYAWQSYVLDKMVTDLREKYKDLTRGNMVWNSANLHIYEKQFRFLTKYKTESFNEYS